MLTFLILNYIITWKTAWDLEDCAFASVGCWVRLLFPNSSIPSSSSAEVGLKRQGTLVFIEFLNTGERFTYTWLVLATSLLRTSPFVLTLFKLRRLRVEIMKSWPPNTFQDLKAVLWKDWPVHKGSNHPKSLKEKVDSLLHLACQDIKCVLVKDQILETYNIQLWLTLGEKYLRD